MRRDVSATISAIRVWINHLWQRIAKHAMAISWCCGVQSEPPPFLRSADKQLRLWWLKNSSQHGSERPTLWAATPRQTVWTRMQCFLTQRSVLLQMFVSVRLLEEQRVKCTSIKVSCNQSLCPLLLSWCSTLCLASLRAAVTWVPSCYTSIPWVPKWHNRDSVCLKLFSASSKHL